MVDMKMNFNEIEEEEIEAEQEDLEVEQQVELYDDDDSNTMSSVAEDAEVDPADVDADVDEEEKQYDDIDRMIFEDDDDDEIIEQLKAIDNYDNESSDSRMALAVTDDDDVAQTPDEDNVIGRFSHSRANNKKHRRRTLTSQPVTGDEDDGNDVQVLPQTDIFEMDNNMLHFVTSTPSMAATAGKASFRRRKRKLPKNIVKTTTTTEQPEIMRIFEGEFNDVYSERIYNESPFADVSDSPQAEGKRGAKDKFHTKEQRTAATHKRHKSAKIVSTMFCEGYNIEQRTCNNFECSGECVQRCLICMCFHSNGKPKFENF